jgi:hypothetical protein
MTDDELREDIIREGAELRADLMALLQNLNDSKFGFLRGSKNIKTLESSFHTIYGKFLLYDGRIFEFLSDTPIARGLEPWKMELRTMSWDKLYAQREVILSLVNNVDSGLSRARSELLNKQAILIAVIALFVSTGLGIISLYIAATAGEPIILSPV